jgi:hypothetical protein
VSERGAGEGPAGAIDVPVAGAEVDRDLLRIAGWALGAGDHLQVAVDGAPARLVARGGRRPDVERAHPETPGAATAGWEAVADLRGVRATSAAVTLHALAPDGTWTELARVDVRLDAIGPRPGTRARAAFTIVQDEPEFLPLWLAYYGRHFAPEDLYVLDHDSSDGSTAALEGRCNVVAVHRDTSFDHQWLRATVERFQAFLLSSYDTVLFAEVDEFVVADPEHHDGLGAYLDGLREPAACCTGFNVVHYPDQEPPLRLGEPILAQRSWWHRSDLYSKRLVARVPLTWGQGFHDEARFRDIAPDPSLLLVHLHRADYERCLARHRASAARTWSARDVESGQGYQNRIVDPGEFRHWFFHVDVGDPERAPIPARVRAQL